MNPPSPERRPPQPGMSKKLMYHVAALHKEGKDFAEIAKITRLTPGFCERICNDLEGHIARFVERKRKSNQKVRERQHVPDVVSVCPGCRSKVRLRYNEHLCVLCLLRGGFLTDDPPSLFPDDQGAYLPSPEEIARITKSIVKQPPKEPKLSLAEMRQPREYYLVDLCTRPSDLGIF